MHVVFQASEVDFSCLLNQLTAIIVNLSIFSQSNNLGPSVPSLGGNVPLTIRVVQIFFPVMPLSYIICKRTTFETFDEINYYFQ